MPQEDGQIEDSQPKPASEGPDVLHRSVAEALRRRVADGRLSGGARLPSLRAIAAEFDVSTMTVRQAMRRLEEEGHVYRVPGVGVFVRPAPPQRAARPRVLAFATSDMISAFSMGIARGVERGGHERGWAMQILDAHNSAELAERNLLDLSESAPQGVILLPVLGEPGCVEALFRIQASGVPMVVVDRRPAGLAADFVESDHEKGAFIATKHLLDHGHRQVLIVTLPPEVSSVAARVGGYERALWGAGIQPRPEWAVWVNQEVATRGFVENRKWLGGYQAVLPVLKACKPPLACFAMDPYIAWGIYEACGELGLSIPGDVSIVSFDDSEVTQAMRPMMTIIRQRTEEVGKIAVELLERRIETGPSGNGCHHAYSHVVIDVDLVQRDSVARV